jgi:hypothetical protein
VQTQVKGVKNVTAPASPPPVKTTVPSNENGNRGETLTPKTFSDFIKSGGKINEPEISPPKEDPLDGFLKEAPNLLQRGEFYSLSIRDNKFERTTFCKFGFNHKFGGFVNFFTTSCL